MKGQRGLAWRGDDSHPERLKTNAVYTLSTHTPAQNSLTKDLCTPREGAKDFRAVTSEISEETSQSPELATARDVLVKSSRSLVGNIYIHTAPRR